MFEKLLGKLHVRVIETDLPKGWWGAYDHATRTIGLRRTLAPIQRRSTLSHELAHAALDHYGHTPRQEREAQELSATWLIRHCEFQHASRIYNTPTALAHELGVLPRDVHAYARLLERGAQYGHP
jgi:Zn-dependent peptidase ImmA (M78 family)